MTPEEVKAAVAEELAALGGHLLGVYSKSEQRDEQDDSLATLGGFLLEHYGKQE